MKGESAVDEDDLFDGGDGDGDEVGLVEVDEVVDEVFVGFWVEESVLLFDVVVALVWLFAIEGVLMLKIASHLAVKWGLQGSHSLVPK